MTIADKVNIVFFVIILDEYFHLVSGLSSCLEKVRKKGITLNIFRSTECKTYLFQSYLFKPFLFKPHSSKPHLFKPYLLKQYFF